jgi:LAO/AO transport system kinase
VNGRAAPIDVERYAHGVLAGERAAIAQSITLVESTRADHQRLAQELLTRLLPHAGGAHRIGISGVPGAGKSTFIDAFGTHLTAQGRKVAVLAVDPSSSRSGGSILGDKTRMSRLALDPSAYIRPSPSAGSLGGVTRSTRQAIVVVEAAGFDIVIVETVGVGQSEIAVAEMVDTFLLLMLARTGDSLQAIKRGVLEIADVLAVNKADGDHVLDAEKAARELATALHLLEAQSASWRPPVLTCSAREDRKIDEVWAQIQAHRHSLHNAGELEEKRMRQETRWMWSLVHDRVMARVNQSPALQDRARAMEEKIRARATTPSHAADELLASLGWWPDERGNG